MQCLPAWAHLAAGRDWVFSALQIWCRRSFSVCYQGWWSRRTFGPANRLTLHNREGISSWVLANSSRPSCRWRKATVRAAHDGANRPTRPSGWVRSAIRQFGHHRWIESSGAVVRFPEKCTDRRNTVWDPPGLFRLLLVPLELDGRPIHYHWPADRYFSSTVRLLIRWQRLWECLGAPDARLRCYFDQIPNPFLFQWLNLERRLLLLLHHLPPHHLLLLRHSHIHSPPRNRLLLRPLRRPVPVLHQNPSRNRMYTHYKTSPVIKDERSR